MFNTLRAEMARRNLTAAELARHINVSALTIAKKMNRDVEWNLNEMVSVRDLVAPHIALDELFSAEKMSKYATAEAFFKARQESAFPEVTKWSVYKDPSDCIRRLKDFFRNPLDSDVLDGPIPRIKDGFYEVVNNFYTDGKTSFSLGNDGTSEIGLVTSTSKISLIASYISKDPSRSAIYIQAASKDGAPHGYIICPKTHPAHDDERMRDLNDLIDGILHSSTKIESLIAEMER